VPSGRTSIRARPNPELAAAWRRTCNAGPSLRSVTIRGSGRRCRAVVTPPVARRRSRDQDGPEPGPDAGARTVPAPPPRFHMPETRSAARAARLQSRRGSESTADARIWAGLLSCSIGWARILACSNEGFFSTGKVSGPYRDSSAFFGGSLILLQHRHDARTLGTGFLNSMMFCGLSGSMPRTRFAG